MSSARLERSVKGTLNQKKAIRLLEEHGWKRTTGGRHQVKMIKAGRRPITLPENKRRDYPIGLALAISQTGRTKMKAKVMKTLNAQIHFEGGSYWADVPDLPGVFATGDTLDELFESLREGVALVVDPEPKRDAIQLQGAVISVE